MTKVVLLLLLIMAGQKPAKIVIPMPDIESCMREATLFLKKEFVPQNGEVILQRTAACTVETPVEDAKQ